MTLAGIGKHRGGLGESKNPDLNDIISSCAAGVFLVAWQVGEVTASTTNEMATCDLRNSVSILILGISSGYELRLLKREHIVRPTFRELGIAPGFIVSSLFFAAVVLLVQFLWLHNPVFILGSRWVNFSLGGLWALTGLLVFAAAIVQFGRCYRQGELRTHGVYALMRHPMYGAWIVFIVSGLVVAWGLVCGLTIPIWMAVVFRLLIGKEESWLEGRFGETYREYRQQVGMLGPRLFRH